MPKDGKKSKKKIIIPIVCVLLAAALGVGGLYLYGNMKMNADTDAEEYIAAIEQGMEWGGKWTDDGFPIQGGYYYSLSGAGASSLRYAIEYILFLKGEGESIDALTADSPYASWNAIAEINFASPYHYYFEGLLYQIQGKSEEAAQAYNNALTSPLFPEALSFYYLRNMEVSELYALRDRLRELETTIYAAYKPTISGYPRDPMNGNAEYMLIQSAIAVNDKDFSLAFDRARIAVQDDPFNPDGFVYAAVTAISCGEYVEAARYIDGGLAFAPENEELNKVRELFVQLSEGLPQEGVE